MTRRLRLLASALACLVGVGLLALPAGAEDSVRIADTGWWWKLQTGAVTSLPPPPDVDPGELVVEGAVDGAQAISAISVVLPEGHTTPTLTLTVAQGGDQGGAAAVLMACQVGAGWTGAEAARWDTKPVVDCSQSVAGIRSDDGTEWAFPVGPLQFADKLNLVIVPGKVDGAPEGLDGSSFRLVFAPPSPESVTTVAGAPPPLTPGPPPAGYTDAPAASAEAGFSSPSPAVPVVPAEPALEPEDQGQTATAPRVQEATQPVLTAHEPEPRTVARLVGLLVLLGGAGYGLLTWRQATTPATTAEGQGGLSRFRRPREGDPPPVS